jgi:hypothetical protein
MRFLPPLLVTAALLLPAIARGQSTTVVSDLPATGAFALPRLGLSIGLAGGLSHLTQGSGVDFGAAVRAVAIGCFPNWTIGAGVSAGLDFFNGRSVSPGVFAGPAWNLLPGRLQLLVGINAHAVSDAGGALLVSGAPVTVWLPAARLALNWAVPLPWSHFLLRRQALFLIEAWGEADASRHRLSFEAVDELPVSDVHAVARTILVGGWSAGVALGLGVLF